MSGMWQGCLGPRTELSQLRCPIDTRVYCPKCGSSDVTTISGASKVASIAMWGIFAANKVKSTYKCCSCGFKF